MIIIKDLKKEFKLGKFNLKILKGINMSVKKGEFVAIIGQSGSGKSTLLNQIGLLDKPSSGDIFIDNIHVDDMDEEHKMDYRLHQIGFVFQDYALLPELTTGENIALPAIAAGMDKDKIKKEVSFLLQEVGLDHRENHMPSELSGGEQQRVAIARALVNKPKLLLADEPCANLDSKSSQQIMNLFKKLNKDLGQTIILITHEPSDEKYVNRVIKVVDGIVTK